MNIEEKMTDEKEDLQQDNPFEMADKSDNNDDSTELKKEGREEITLLIHNRTPSQAFFLDLPKQCGKTLKEIRSAMAAQGVTLPRTFKFMTLSDNLLTVQAEDSVMLSEVLRRKTAVKDGTKLDYETFDGFEDKTDDQDGSSARENATRKSRYEVKIFPLKTKKKNSNKAGSSSASPDQESPLVDASTISLLSGDPDAEDEALGQGQSQGQGQARGHGGGEATGRPCPFSAFNKFMFGNCPLTRQSRCPLTVFLAFVLALPVALILMACTAYSILCLLGPGTAEAFLPVMPGVAGRAELTALEHRLDGLEAGQREAQAQMMQALGAMTTLTRELHAALHAEAAAGDGSNKKKLSMEPVDISSSKKKQVKSP